MHSVEWNDDTTLPEFYRSRTDNDVDVVCVSYVSIGIYSYPRKLFPDMFQRRALYVVRMRVCQKKRVDLIKVFFHLAEWYPAVDHNVFDSDRIPRGTRRYDVIIQFRCAPPFRCDILTM